MDPIDPFAPPKAADRPATKPLGSLAQSARGKELKQVQGILIVIGLLNLAFYGFSLYNTPNEVDRVIRQQQNLAPGQVEQVRQFVTYFLYTIYGGFTALGALFVLLGLIVKKAPVAVTVISLVLYLVVNLGVIALNPMALAQGAIVKIVVVVALIRAIGAARAYEAETRAMRLAGELPG
jgi:hypothetical protein